nr:26S proteasome non-ATPase regulatory subunit 2-like [Onthophagus taurus]XP_022919748.1 26S proteasome non-ATPase regulatory subunit 2-like [Onthophagus taurus]
MATTATIEVDTKSKEMSEEDRELQDELKLLVDRILGSDLKLIPPSLEMLKFMIRTSTTSMTSVPKPLKYLASYYHQLIAGFERMKEGPVKKQLADIISVLSMGPVYPENRLNKPNDCLKYCLLGTMSNIGDWGHEYIRQLEIEIVPETYSSRMLDETIENLVKDIIKFNCEHHAEIQACDLLMEIDKLEYLPPFIDKSIYARVCLYLKSCAKYVDDIESEKILSLVADQYVRFEEYTKALIVAINLNEKTLANEIFQKCKDPVVLKQLAFIAARQLFSVDLSDLSSPDKDDLTNILNNTHLSAQFQNLTRELDVMEPKSPEDVYKTWLEPSPSPLRPSILTASAAAENIDSARQNLAASFVNGFVNAGFGVDKLLTTDDGNRWIYRNKDHGMMSATAALGMLYLWDVDGGLTPIDKYLYSKDDQIKAGALLALGIVNCRVHNDCDPALALLADFANDTNLTLRSASIFGLGLAYTSTNRADVLALLVPAIETAKTAESFAIASLACGLIAIGTCNPEIVQSILTKLVDWRDTDQLKTPHSLLGVLGLGMCFMGRKDCIETSVEALQVFPEPFCSASKTILHMCSYAGSGDVCVIQEFLNNCGEKICNNDQYSSNDSNKETKGKEKKKSKLEFDPSIAQAITVLGIGAVAIGDDVGSEMCHRVLGSVGRYGDPSVRRVVPLSVALNSISKPDLNVIDLLTKYSHDSDDKMACNAIFALGIVGAGTNNARLASNLRQLAVYHAKNPSELFMVRIAQGLTHMGKGTMTLSPWHTDRQLVDLASLAGILIPLVALIDPHALILGRNHFLLYALAIAIQPRWLLTLDENLHAVSVPVRVGQAVDVVGKAGNPKTIAGIHTHSTPVLLASGERAELATCQFEQLSPVLDGICILKRKSDDADSIVTC